MNKFIKDVKDDTYAKEGWPQSVSTFSFSFIYFDRLMEFLKLELLLWLKYSQETQNTKM